MRTALLIWLAVSVTTYAQDKFTVSFNKKDTSYSDESFDVPADFTLFDLSMKSKPVAMCDLAFVQVWSECCGAEPEAWAEVTDIIRLYGDLGLQWISINFENGINMRQMKEKMNNYFATREQPENLYLDPMGDAIDGLKVSGFPTYLLVKDGRVVFRTNGRDEEGVAMLRSAIEKYTSDTQP